MGKGSKKKRDRDLEKVSAEAGSRAKTAAARR